jgi:hypothetical protein
MGDPPPRRAAGNTPGHRFPPVALALLLTPALILPQAGCLRMAGGGGGPGRSPKDAGKDAGTDGGRDPGNDGAAEGDRAGDAGAGGGSAGCATATDAGADGARLVIAATPPMGWNSWNRFQGSVSDAVVRQTADAMVASGMAAAGYQYVVIDDT